MKYSLLYIFTGSYEVFINSFYTFHQEKKSDVIVQKCITLCKQQKSLSYGLQNEGLRNRQTDLDSTTPSLIWSINKKCFTVSMIMRYLFFHSL